MPKKNASRIPLCSARPIISSADRTPGSAAAPEVDGPRAFRLSKARSLLDIGPTKMAELVREGPEGQPPELQSFLIGRCRYITAEALRDYIHRQIERSRKVSTAERENKMSAATRASLVSRGHRALGLADTGTDRPTRLESVKGSSHER